MPPQPAPSHLRALSGAEPPPGARAAQAARRAAGRGAALGPGGQRRCMAPRRGAEPGSAAFFPRAARRGCLHPGGGRGPGPGLGRGGLRRPPAIECEPERGADPEGRGRGRLGATRRRTGPFRLLRPRPLRAQPRARAHADVGAHTCAPAHAPGHARTPPGTPGQDSRSGHGRQGCAGPTPLHPWLSHPQTVPVCLAPPHPTHTSRTLGDRDYL